MVDEVKVSSITPGMKGVNATLTVSNVGDVREVNTRNGAKQVCDCTAEDDSGSIKLVLWQDEVDRVMNQFSKDHKPVVRLRDGYANLYKNELQVMSGLYGELEVEENASGRGPSVPE